MNKTHSSRKKQNIFVFGEAVLTFFALVLLSSCQSKDITFSRGIGVYPGAETENFAPKLKPDQTHYRNIALHRPAFHSSSYDYNLTAQLITDGIIETKMPLWIAITSSREYPIKKNEREWLLDNNPVTTLNIKGSKGWVQFELGGMDELPVIDQVDLIISMRRANDKLKKWSCQVSGSEDGKEWQILGQLTGNGTMVDTSIFPYGKIFTPSIPFVRKTKSRFYRINFDSNDLKEWDIAEAVFLHAGKKLAIRGSDHFTSAWMSAGNQNEWVYIDLGSQSTFDRVVLNWIQPAIKGVLQVSNDAEEWQDIQELPESTDLIQDLKLKKMITGRYVRLLMNQAASPQGYILSEFEILGRGGLIAVPKPMPLANANGRLNLAGGNWKVQRANLVKEGGEVLSSPKYKDENWVVATVPATTLVSYWNAGALPNPNFGSNQLMISESFFLSDFWYRDLFMVPSSYSGKHMWLNFDGINWKAQIFLNGKNIGRIDGAFTRGRFDVSSLLLPGQINTLAVRIQKNAHPGGVKEQTYYSPDKNGGVLGADNPTYHASIGWDWIPTIRGRNTGIWNDVYLDVTGPVSIENPYVTTQIPLPDTTIAEINFEITLQNHNTDKIDGTLYGSFGKLHFEEPVHLEAMETHVVKINPENHPELSIKNPRLWWPAGYGQPNLYKVDLIFKTADNKVSDTKSFKTGIRQMAYSEKGGVLKIWVNGKRFTGRGGNWGFPESMLRYRAREYDIAVRYHRDMNFTMIRNWVGQTGDDEFYEACDKYGIMIWNDFWLANPWDGPDPDHNKMFMQNVKDEVLRIRNHPSLGLYCGRNEGFPPKPIDDGIREVLKTYQPGLHYIPNSADEVVSGHGPYQAMPVKYYFEKRATPRLHSEMGMPNIVSLESLHKMMPDSALWPQGPMWGLHDFCAFGAQGANSFRERIEKSYGPVNNVKDWVTLAQFVNYEGYRAMFEAQSKHRMGLLLWMSHPAWPSLVWQTYDYYFEPTAAYFGCKKASEPLHIQWNPLSDSIEVVNYSGKNAKELKAQTQILNLDGFVKWEKSIALDLPEDSTAICMGLTIPSGLTPVYFIRLKLFKETKLISENFYWRGLEENNFKALRTLPEVELQTSTITKRTGNKWILHTKLKNLTKTPALMVRLKVDRKATGDRILPVIYSDNYFPLMPGEERTIVMEFAHADTRGEKPGVVIEGFNLKQ